ncbi:ribonuclease P protein subunit p25-like protein [Asterias amurensis]|uniref:ribonuclease P protein subunit p25-like protein n=1 Tax=Asterias amurensis TaxID=7602 RepID=UPI003AB2B85D
MDHYEKGEIVEVHGEDDKEKTFSNLGLDLSNITTMKVKHGSKVRNLLGFAFKVIKNENTKYIIFTGSGPAISKTITCVEIVKRKMKTLHQITRIFYNRIDEYWNPKEEGLDRLKVSRDIPTISILLSKESLPSQECGYQAPGSYDHLWADGSEDKNKKKNQSRKRKQDKNSNRADVNPGQSQTTDQNKPIMRKPSGKKNRTKNKVGAAAVE